MRCKYCGCAGWFFALDDEGLCEQCGHLLRLEVEQRLRTIEENKNAAEQTLNPHSKIAKLDIVVDNLEALARHERKGIKSLPTSAVDEHGKSLQGLKRLVARTAGSEFKAALARLAAASSSGEKIKLLTNFRLKLESLAPRTRASFQIRALEAKVRDAIERIRISSALEAAQNAQREGNRPEALRAYKEALLHLEVLEAGGLGLASQKTALDGKIRELA